MKDGKHVALTKCFYCGGDHQILLATRYRSDGSPVGDVSKAHGCVIDMSPCNKCEGYMKQGIIVIVVDDAKSPKNWHIPPTYQRERDHWMPNPHRTGHFAVVRDELITRIFDKASSDNILRHRWTFMEYEVAEKIGMIAQIQANKESES